MYIVANKIYDDNDSNAIDIDFGDDCRSCRVNIYEKSESGKLETVIREAYVDMSTAYVERRPMFVYVCKNNEVIIKPNHNFAIDYNIASRKHLGKKMNMKLNFLFDYEKQFLFDKRGVLYSRTAKDICNSDESSRYIQDWLRNS